MAQNLGEQLRNGVEGILQGLVLCRC
jgi:hypothetical protein